MQANDAAKPEPTPSRTSLAQMFAFFIPLGISQSLVTLSHVIINGTLARSANPELIISSYAIGLSLIGITEKPAVLLRQTCSALVRDRVSFRALTGVAIYLFISIFVFGLLVSYSPFGHWVFGGLFGTKPEQVDAVVHVYRVLMYVSIFSGIRCLFHGVIIFNKRTAWLTLGMVFRLVAMYALSQYFILTDTVNSGQVGALIFLVGMVIECVIAWWEGQSLVRKKLPEKLPEHPVENKGHVFHFYRPLLYSSFLAVIISPSINAVLGKTPDVERAIAAFAVAGSVYNLMVSFFSYIHQIVLNFYRTDPGQVRRFLFILVLLPTLFLGVLGYTPLGPWFLTHVMGVKEQLLAASLSTLRVFMIMTLVFPWLDYMNGMIMLKGQTKIMVWSQASNVVVTLLTLAVCIVWAPGLNGMIGSLAQSLGMGAELAFVVWALRRLAKSPDRLPGVGSA